MGSSPVLGICFLPPLSSKLYSCWVISSLFLVYSSSCSMIGGIVLLDLHLRARMHGISETASSADAYPQIEVSSSAHALCHDFATNLTTSSPMALKSHRSFREGFNLLHIQYVIATRATAHPGVITRMANGAMSPSITNPATQALLQGLLVCVSWFLHSHR